MHIAIQELSHSEKETFTDLHLGLVCSRQKNSSPHDKLDTYKRLSEEFRTMAGNVQNWPEVSVAETQLSTQNMSAGIKTAMSVPLKAFNNPGICR